MKLAGGRGDKLEKLLFKLPKKNAKTEQKKAIECCDCPPFKGIRINNMSWLCEQIQEKHEREAAISKSETRDFTKKLSNYRPTYSKPGPMSKKTTKRSSLDMEFDPLEVITLPTVQLEVWPQIGRSLPDRIKPLLKSLLPESNVITTEWAHFAVSVVKNSAWPPKHRRKYKKPEPEPSISFVFNIPYVNNQRRILVRRRKQQLSITQNSANDPIDEFYKPQDENILTFARNIDRSEPLTAACADVLTNLINSVAITSNENNFIKNDPDIDYTGKVSEEAIKDRDKANIEQKESCNDALASKGDSSISKLKIM